jgi:hypothetical protein
VASKDKGGKAVKTTASKSLKQKRADKKEKKVRRDEHRTI